jgi:hypothetical protein
MKAKHGSIREVATSDLGSAWGCMQMVRALWCGGEVNTDRNRPAWPMKRNRCGINFGLDRSLCKEVASRPADWIIAVLAFLCAGQRIRK